MKIKSRNLLKGLTCVCALILWENPLLRAKDVDVLLLSPQVASQNDPGLNMTLVSSYLNTMLGQAPDFAGSSCTWHSQQYIDSLHEAYYDPRYSSSTAAAIAGDYDVVVLVPYFEYLTWAPEFVFEGVWNLGREILELGAEPILLMGPGSVTGNFATSGENAYRIANGCGISVNPAGYTLSAQGLYLPSTGNRQAYVVAASLYAQITGLNAADLPYMPVSGSEALANSATSIFQQHQALLHYNTSRHDSGMVRYRTVDISSAPFNGTVRYGYVGTSTEDGISSHLRPLITANGWSYATSKVSSSGGGSKYWTDTDFELAKPAFDANPHKFHFVYARGTSSNGPQLVNYNQSNLMPITFDRHYDNIGSGSASTQAMLQDIDAGSWFRYYYQKTFGWNSVPFHVGATRLYHADNSVIVSSDSVHVTTPFYNLIASMLLTSSLGQDIQPTTAIQNSPQSLLAFNIGKQVVKQLAYLSEDSVYVPDSQLLITTDQLNQGTTLQAFTQTLSASGGVPPYTWEHIASSGLPDGLSISSAGLLSGTPTATAAGTHVLVFKVTDSAGSIRKRALRVFLENAASPEYDNWAGYVFDNSGLGMNQQTLDQDPEGDGLSNFLEYALGLNPLLSDAPNAVDWNWGNMLQARFPYARAHLRYTIEATSDLNDWTNASIIWDSVLNANTLGPLGEDQLVEAELDEELSQFFRLRVSN